MVTVTLALYKSVNAEMNQSFILRYYLLYYGIYISTAIICTINSVSGGSLSLSDLFYFVYTCIYMYIHVYIYAYIHLCRL